MKAAFSFLFLSVALIAHGAQLPVSGLPVSELALIDSAMQDIMQTHNIGAGVIAVSRNGVPIYNRAFGWQDRNRTVPLAPNAIMRIASVTKPLTAAAVRKLISQGHIGLNQRVFSVDEPGTGILDFTPFGTPDARMKDITVNNLLQHRGGWDRDIAGDHTYRERTIATAMGLPSPPGREATTRWIMGQPLQHNPGSTYAYSNIGYMVLGQIVEKVTGEKLIDYVRDEVFTPKAGWPAPQLIHGRTFAADQDPREPYYDSTTTSVNVFYPTESSSPFVSRPYGGWDHESRIGQGGVVTDALTILDYLNRYQIAGDNIGAARSVFSNSNWTHTGAFAGTNSIARQRSDGISFAVIFNKQRSSGDSYTTLIGNALNTIFSSGQITAWPTANITQYQVSVPGDYNLDGIVNAADYALWRDTQGKAVRAGTGADGSGNGTVDTSDYSVWAGGFNRVLPMPTANSLGGPAYPVPEPSAIGMLLIVSLLTITTRQRCIRR